MTGIFLPLRATSSGVASDPGETAPKGSHDAVTAGETATNPTSPPKRDLSTSDKASLGAGSQAEAPHAGTGSRTPAGREGHSEAIRGVSRRGRANRPAFPVADAIGFGLMTAAFFGWYVALCPPASAATAGDGGTVTTIAPLPAALARAHPSQLIHPPLPSLGPAHFMET